MLKFLRTFFEQPDPELTAIFDEIDAIRGISPVEQRAPAPLKRKAKSANAHLHQVLKQRRFHERHATRQRRLAQQLIADARASGLSVWEN
jgi:hypothetical protein